MSAACSYVCHSPEEAMISLSDIPSYLGSARYKTTVSGSGLARFLEEYRNDGGIDLDPDFQRGHVWDEGNRIKFIEHLLRGGEFGRSIVWNTPTHDHQASTHPDRDLSDTMVLVDGKQRLTAILRFLDNDLAVFGGIKLSDFDEPSYREIMTVTGRLRLDMNIYALQRRDDLIRLYLELNEGAVAHEPSEIARVRSLLNESAA